MTSSTSATHLPIGSVRRSSFHVATGSASAFAACRSSQLLAFIAHRPATALALRWLRLSSARILRLGAVAHARHVVSSASRRFHACATSRLPSLASRLQRTRSTRTAASPSRSDAVSISSRAIELPIDRNAEPCAAANCSGRHAGCCSRLASSPPPPFRSRLRRPPQSLSLGSLGVSAHAF